MKKVIYVFIFLLIVGINPLKAQTEKVPEEVLTTLGVCSGQGVYLTYTSIGTLADAYVKGVYEKDFTLTLLKEYETLSNTLNDQLDKLLRAKILDSADAEFIKTVQETYLHLALEARSYINFVESKDKKFQSEYDVHRNNAWKLIEKILGK